MSYFNTTSVTRPELMQFQHKAMTQQESVLEAMKTEGSATASKIWRMYFSDNCPITSIRRSLTCLVTDGHLTKTSVKKVGLWGRPEYVYKIKDHGDI